VAARARWLPSNRALTFWYIFRVYTISLFVIYVLFVNVCHQAPTGQILVSFALYFSCILR